MSGAGSPGLLYLDAVDHYSKGPYSRSSMLQEELSLRKCHSSRLKEFLTFTMDKFFTDMEREKPIRFSSQQIKIATDNFTNFLGSGGFRAVYKGMFSNGVTVAVKILNGNSYKRIDEQFMAEVSIIGRTHHFNLVRLHGFCFERNLRALVYEFMVNGSLDRFLFQQNTVIKFEKLHEIAVGTAKGIAYLHEECQQRIMHYDIMLGNILLDGNFTPKVAKLTNRDNTRVTMTGGRGLQGMLHQSCGCHFLLLFEVIGQRRNLDITLPDCEEWFLRWVWNKYEKGELANFMLVCVIEEKDREMAERMVKVALWCVQYRPMVRPLMSLVVKMLEGGIDMLTPMNPFQHLCMLTPSPNLLGSTTLTLSQS